MFLQFCTTATSTKCHSPQYQHVKGPQENKKIYIWQNVVSLQKSKMYFSLAKINILILAIPVCVLNFTHRVNFKFSMWTDLEGAGMKCVCNTILVCAVLTLVPTFSLIFTGELISAISPLKRMLSVKRRKKQIRWFLIPTWQRYTHVNCIYALEKLEKTYLSCSIL